MSSPSEPEQNPTTYDDALSFLKEVKDAFKDRADKYEEFLSILMDYKNDDRIDLSSTVARLEELFKGHEGLILGLNSFLPEGYEITPVVRMNRIHLP